MNDHWNQIVGTSAGLRTHRNANSNGNNDAAECQPKNGEEEGTVLWQKTAKQIGIKVHQRPKAENTKERTRINVSFVK